MSVWFATMKVSVNSAPGRVLGGFLIALAVGVAAGGAAGAPQPHHPFGAHTYAYATGSIRPSDVPQSRTDGETKRFYDAWKKRYLTKGCGPDRYYVYVREDGEKGSGPPSISFSEGHGYGMVITSLMAGYDPNAQTYFDGLYRFFKDHPSMHSSQLMAWDQVQGCGNSKQDDPDSATDGDLDIAYALILADRQWGSSGRINYLQEAKNVIAAIYRKEIHPVTFVVLLGDFVSPAQPAYYDGTRASDFMPDHFRAFQAVTGDRAWTRVIDAGYRLVGTMQSRFAPTTGLVPDFIQNTQASPRPAAAGYMGTRHAGQFSYNACRVPLRLATDYLVSGDPRALAAVQRVNAWVRRQTGEDPSRVRDGYQLSGASYSSDRSLAFTAPLAVAAMVDSSNQRWANALWRFLVKSPLEESTYYGNTLKLFSMIVASGNWWAP